MATAIAVVTVIAVATWAASMVTSVVNTAMQAVPADMQRLLLDGVGTAADLAAARTSPVEVEASMAAVVVVSTAAADAGKTG
jgi:hypothetical protein